MFPRWGPLADRIEVGGHHFALLEKPAAIKRYYEEVSKLPFKKVLNRLRKGSSNIGLERAVDAIPAEIRCKSI